METTNETGKTPAGAQSRAGEAGANLSVGLGTYAIYGINGRGEIYLHATKPCTAGDDMSDDDGLGEYWAGNEKVPKRLN